MQQFHNILATLLHLRNKVHVAHWYINGDISIRSLCEDYDILDKFINKIPSSKDRVQENLLAIVQEQVEKYRWFLDATLGK
jgi:DNA-binding ferritin-like protein